MSDSVTARGWAGWGSVPEGEEFPLRVTTVPPQAVAFTPPGTAGPLPTLLTGWPSNELGPR